MSLGNTSLHEWLGDIDIYVLDQILRERIQPGMRILDAGCGAGRNLLYLMRAGYDVSGVDQSPQAVAAVSRLALHCAPGLSADAFRTEPVERMSFESASFDVVISSAVLHFASSESHFRAMVDELWRVLRPGGMLFARLASTIGMAADKFTPLGGRRFRLPDGSERFLVDESMLMEETARLGGELIDPIKTTVVQNARCMTTWVVRAMPR